MKYTGNHAYRVQAIMHSVITVCFNAASYFTFVKRKFHPLPKPKCNDEFQSQFHQFGDLKPNQHHFWRLIFTQNSPIVLLIPPKLAIIWLLSVHVCVLVILPSSIIFCICMCVEARYIDYKFCKFP